MAKLKPVTLAQLDAILPFLAAFEAMGFQCGYCPQSEPDSPNAAIIPCFDESDPVESFMQALHDHDWITSFDWKSWQTNADALVADRGAIATANAETIRKLLTTHVRKDRTCEGHLARLFESGHISALLRRLQTIRKHHEQR